MGEMADWINDNGFFAMLMGEDILEPSLVMCRNCGEGNLHWDISPDNNKWRLYDRNCKLHNCPVRPLKQGQ
jgi:hypothetical protein